MSFKIPASQALWVVMVVKLYDGKLDTEVTRKNMQC